MDGIILYMSQTMFCRITVQINTATRLVLNLLSCHFFLRLFFDKENNPDFTKMVLITGVLKHWGEMNNKNIILLLCYLYFKTWRSNPFSNSYKLFFYFILYIYMCLHLKFLAICKLPKQTKLWWSSSYRDKILLPFEIRFIWISTQPHI